MRLLEEAVLRLRDTPELRVLLIRATGRLFCAGADLRGGGDGRKREIGETEADGLRGLVGVGEHRRRATHFLTSERKNFDEFFPRSSQRGSKSGESWKSREVGAAVATREDLVKAQLRAVHDALRTVAEAEAISTESAQALARDREALDGVERDLATIAANRQSGRDRKSVV